MKTTFFEMKQILLENKEDLLYLIFVGIPSGLIAIVLNLLFEIAELY